MLDLLEVALDANGFNFQRIDGQRSLENRAKALHSFANDPTCTVMLASTGSVAEG
jgi:SNF2 family DNA or RNA helicase